MNQLSTVTIQDLESSFEEFTKVSRDEGKAISKNISMLQLDTVRDSIAESIMTIEGMVNREDKVGILGKFGITKWISKGKAKLDEESMKNGKMTETIDRLFKSMSDKQDNIMKVMESLYQIKEKLQNEMHIILRQQQEAAPLAQEDSFVGMKARNILVQLQKTVLKTKERIETIDATLKAAEASSMQISAMMPALQGELVTELSIQAGLQELKEYKETFDATMNMIEEINSINQETVGNVLSAVVELSISTGGTEVARIEKNQEMRNNLRTKLAKTLEERRQEQEQAIERLKVLQDKNGVEAKSLLGFKN